MHSRCRRSGGDQLKGVAGVAIVIGSHGRRGVHRLTLGSVAEGVARISSKLLLLIRSE